MDQYVIIVDRYVIILEQYVNISRAVAGKWRYLGNGHAYGAGCPFLSDEVDTFILVRASEVT